MMSHKGRLIAPRFYLNVIEGEKKNPILKGISQILAYTDEDVRTYSWMKIW